MQVMLLGFVLLGRSLEEKARIQASSDMNELLVSSNAVHLFRLVIFQEISFQKNRCLLCILSPS